MPCLACPLAPTQPPMVEKRKRLVMMAFQKLDKTGDGVITVEDLKGVYDVRQHPKFMSGEWTEDEVLLKFLDTFESDGDRGTITKVPSGHGWA